MGSRRQSRLPAAVFPLRVQSRRLPPQIVSAEELLEKVLRELFPALTTTGCHCRVSGQASPKRAYDRRFVGATQNGAILLRADPPLG
jgi:hypothetical protein